MEFIRGIHNIKPRHFGCVLTIGNFDGVHLGHQQVIKRVVSQAKALNLPAMVMTFEPQPMEFFAPHKAPARLTRMREKVCELSLHHIDRLLCINFNQSFADLTPQAFIDDLLVSRLGVKFLVVGDDFCFGKNRQGGFEDLKQAGKRHGFEVVSTKTFTLEANEELALDDDKAHINSRVSSTQVRSALAEGNIDAAHAMLGREYAITGRVSHGRKLGRTIGFPTANVPLKRHASPVFGVFAVSVRINSDTNEHAKIHHGVANIGYKPTVNTEVAQSKVNMQLEVHLFDFDEDLYGDLLEVTLKHKLRDEKKFDSFELLKRQIKVDADAARVWLQQ